MADKKMNGFKQYLLAEKDSYQGYVDERFQGLAEQFSRMQDARSDQGGAAVAVYFQGQKVVLLLGRTFEGQPR